MRGFERTTAPGAPGRWLSIAAAAIVATACGGGPATEPRKAAGEAPAGAPAKEAGTVNIYIWSAYLPPEVLDDFKAKTGINYNVDTYDSNEALLAKLQSGVADYDIVVPSDYMVKILIGEKLVQPIDHGRIPNWNNLDPKLLDMKFDPQNVYSMPYFWGTTGLGYNKQKIQGPVDSWQVLFDPKYKGRILMLDDVRENFTVALKLMGKSLNETDPAVLKQAAEMLKKQHKLVKTYDSGDFANILDTGDVDLAHGYNGQIAEVVAKSPDRLAYVMPKEGGTRWMDNICITTGSRNIEAAYALINYILEPEVGARIVNEVNYASANAAAMPLIKPEITGNSAIYASDETLSHCEFIEDLGDVTTQMDEYWTEIKAQ